MELELGKETTEKHEANFLDLHIKVKNGNFKVSLFDKRDLASLIKETHFLFLLLLCECHIKYCTM